MADEWGWHVLDENKRLRYDDDRKVEVGVRMTMMQGGEGLPVICCRGMHASPTIKDALTYRGLAYDRWLCRVIVHDVVPHGRKADKFVGVSRTAVAMVQSHSVLYPSCYTKADWLTWAKGRGLLGDPRDPLHNWAPYVPARDANGRFAKKEPVDA